MSLRCVLAALLAAVALAAPQTAYNPAVNGLNEAGQVYQLGVWSAILLAVVGIYGFYSVANIDYSGDSLFFVDVSEHVGEHSE